MRKISVLHIMSDWAGSRKTGRVVCPVSNLFSPAPNENLVRCRVCYLTTRCLVFTQFNDHEDQALQGLRPHTQVIYLRGIRRFMDFETGLVGIKRKISYQSLSEACEFLPDLGSKLPGERQSKEAIRASIKELIRANLVIKISYSDKRFLVFKCVLADWDESVQKRNNTRATHEHHTLSNTPQSSEIAQNESIPIPLDANSDNGWQVFEDDSGKIDSSDMNNTGTTHPVFDRNNTHQISNINTRSLSTNTRENFGSMGEPIPPDFAVTDTHRAMAKMMGGPEPETCIDAFIGHQLSKGKLSVNWDGEFRKWMAQEKVYRATLQNKIANNPSHGKSDKTSSIKTKDGGNHEKHQRVCTEFEKRYAGALSPSARSGRNIETSSGGVG